MFAGSKKSSKKEKSKNKGKKREEFTELQIEIEPVENVSNNNEESAIRSDDLSQHFEGF
jgi:hypothetical protein